jgi:hypothetical protein
VRTAAEAPQLLFRSHWRYRPLMSDKRLTAVDPRDLAGALAFTLRHTSAIPNMVIEVRYRSGQSSGIAGGTRRAADSS